MPLSKKRQAEYMKNRRALAKRIEKDGELYLNRDRVIPIPNCPDGRYRE